MRRCSDHVAARPAGASRQAGGKRALLTAATLADGRPATQPSDDVAIGQRLDRLPLTGLHVAIFALCTLGLAADIGEVALSNTFSAIFLAPPYNASRPEVSWLLAAVFAGGAVGAPVF